MLPLWLSREGALIYKSPMKKLFSFLVGCAFSVLGLQAATVNLQHIHPLHWWVGMSDPELQIMLHGDNISQYEPVLRAQGVKLLRTERATNPKLSKFF